MNVGFVGLGKLGMPCAVAAALRGHTVLGYDRTRSLMSRRPRAWRESGPDGSGTFNHWLRKSAVRFSSIEEICASCEIIFVCVQTPHLPELGGSRQLAGRRADFNYAYLAAALEQLAACIRRPTVVAVVSTVLPGTLRSRIVPVLKGNPAVRLCYNPFFIAMGTAMRDFLNPEFVLCGSDDARAASVLKAFYRRITPAPFFSTSMESAEVIKVGYNTFIGMKIVFANTMMEICHKIPGADVDAVSAAFALATDRLLSPRYLGGGMGDGGSCHPRDNIAMSWLARRLGLSCDIFNELVSAREKQTAWLADMADAFFLPVVVLGKAFKPGTNITDGSPALLLAALLRRRGKKVVVYDPYVDRARPRFKTPGLFYIAARHPDWVRFRFPRGSVVIDPWRYIPDRPGVTVIRIGVCAPGRF